MRFTSVRQLALRGCSVLLLGFLTACCGLPFAHQKAPDSPTIYIVRHAEKQAESGRDPKLSETGQKQASDLAEWLKSKNADITLVVTTPYHRTRNTGTPAANLFSAPAVTVSVEGGLDAHIAEIAERIKQHSGNTLVIGHSNTVMPILRALGGPTKADLTDSDYGDIWVLKNNQVSHHIFTDSNTQSHSTAAH